jgi:hypothetical protein
MFTQHGKEFVYYTAEEGEVVQVGLYYTKGRGIYASLRPITRERTDYGHTESYLLFDDRAIRVLLLPLTRGNPSKLAALAAKLSPVVAEAAALLLADKTAAAKLLRDAVGV